MSDRELRAAVEEALDWEPIIDAKGIGVSAKEGVLTLSGHVPSYPQKRESEKIAALVRGVKAVVCELQIRLPSPSKRSDGSGISTERSRHRPRAMPRPPVRLLHAPPSSRDA